MGGSEQKKTSNSKGGGLNVVLCIVCAVCVVASVHNGWNDRIQQHRLGELEERVAALERAGTGEDIGVLMARMRRDVEERSVARAARVARDTQLRHRVETRDAPECICPTGK